MSDVHPADVFCMAHMTYAVACCGGTTPAPPEGPGCGRVVRSPQLFRPLRWVAPGRWEEFDEVMMTMEGT